MYSQEHSSGASMARLAMLGVVLLAAVSLASAAYPQTAAVKSSATSNAEEAQTIAQEAYLYLYPLVLMDLTRKQFTNLDPKTSQFGGPANNFTHVRAFPAADARSVVRPNFDTLYSSAWLDLTGGPVVVSTADTGGRYFLLPMLDMWTDVFAAPGARTNGTRAANFAVVPPGWQGKLPADVERIDAPTPHVWLLGRTQTNGVKDYDTVHKIQDGYRITLLPDWGKTARKAVQKIDPAVNTKTEPLRLVNEMPATEFFSYGAELLKLHPPHRTDWSTIARLKRIGIEPGKSFDSTKTTPEMLAQATAAGLTLMEKQAQVLTGAKNGWQINTNTIGVYGNFYLQRAIIARMGLGANQPEDAVYPLAIADAGGKPIVGENNYVLHFAKDELPPVGAFWSLTMYDQEGFQIANPLNRFALGDRDPLKFNGDGSLDLFVQHASPGPDKEANWLPGPKSGVLGLTMRLYAPKPQVVDGRWAPPGVERVGEGRAVKE